MRSAPRRTMLFVAIAVIALCGSTVAAVAASREFGYHKVREGLPEGLRHFSLTSTDLKGGKRIPQKFWGCTGTGVSPELSWHGAPAATKSYAVTMFDTDAPTGSGFWHWVAWDLP